MKVIKTAKWSDRLRGGKADKHEPSDFDQKQLAKGVKVEMEHTDKPDVAKEIAMDHLVESKDFKDGKGKKYYDFLESIEQQFE